MPHHSARIQLAGLALKPGSKRAAALRRMAAALLGPVLEKAAEAAAAAEAEAEAGAEAAAGDAAAVAAAAVAGGMGEENVKADGDPTPQTRRSVGSTGGQLAQLQSGSRQSVGRSSQSDAAATTSLVRADVHFAAPLRRSINAMIGRKAGAYTRPLFGST